MNTAKDDMTFRQAIRYALPALTVMLAAAVLVGLIGWGVIALVVWIGHQWPAATLTFLVTLTLATLVSAAASIR